MLKLASPIRSAVLPRIDNIPKALTENESLWALGRSITFLSSGSTFKVQDRSTHWRKTEMPAVATARCSARYPSANLEKAICTGRDAPHLAPCTGDTGSPLVRGRGADQPPELLGLMAFGTGCGTPGDYSVSVAVPPYLAWIRETIKR